MTAPHRTPLSLFSLLAALCLLFTAALPLSSLAQAKKILPLGDSITQGKNRTYPSYRPRLWQLLQNGGYNVNFIGSMRNHHEGSGPGSGYDPDHEGHWGWRSDQVINGCSSCTSSSGTGKLSDWLQTYTPDIVLLHLGTNDMNESGSDEKVVERTIKELGQIINILRNDNPNVTILLAQLIPSSKPPRDRRIPMLNARIPALAAEKDRARSRVLVVNHYAGFDVNEDTYDGTHPDASGERKMAKKWSQALSTVLGSSSAMNVSSEPSFAVDSVLIPDRVTLEGNYPNPFNPSTEIRFALPEAGHTLLVVFDVIGREVARLVDSPLEAGHHAVTWEASALPSGLYLYRLTSGRFTEVRPMVLTK